MTNFQKILTDIVNNDLEGQKGVAAKLNVEAPYISMLLNNKRKLSKDLAVVFGKIYNYDPDELLRTQDIEKIGLRKDEISTLSLNRKPVRNDNIDYSKLPIEDKLSYLINQNIELKKDNDEIKKRF